MNKSPRSVNIVDKPYGDGRERVVSWLQWPKRFQEFNNPELINPEDYCFVMIEPDKGFFVSYEVLRVVIRNNPDSPYFAQNTKSDLPWNRLKLEYNNEFYNTISIHRLKIIDLNAALADMYRMFDL